MKEANLKKNVIFLDFQMRKKLNIREEEFDKSHPCLKNLINMISEEKMISECTNKQKK